MGLNGRVQAVDSPHFHMVRSTRQAHNQRSQFTPGDIIRGLWMQEIVYYRPTRDRPAIVELPDQRPRRRAASRASPASSPAPVRGRERLGLNELCRVNIAL